MCSLALLIARKLPFFFQAAHHHRIEILSMDSDSVLQLSYSSSHIYFYQVYPVPSQFLSKEICLALSRFKKAAFYGGYPPSPRLRRVKRIVGAFGGGVLPLPIPNRAVKPVSADGTGSDVPGE